VCDISRGATSTQLEAALWACVLEYRALYSQCLHLVKPVKPPPPITAVPRNYCAGPSRTGPATRLRRCYLA
jgi:hypothetical protein